MTEQQHSVLACAVETFGADAQLNVAIEELSELIKELCKYKRGEGKEIHIAEEMADVKIILEELEIIFRNGEAVSICEQFKIDRLRERIAENELRGDHQSA